MEQQLTIPPRTENESHEEYMNNFINLLVSTTKNASEFTKLQDDAQKLFRRIIECRETMLKAAKNKHSSAVIFGYCVNRTNGVYDLLFPTGNIAAQMEKYGIVPVFQRVQNHLKPLIVEHSMYEVYDGDTREVINITGQLILPGEVEEESESCSEESLIPEICVEIQDSQDISETTPVEGVKKLKPVRRHIGVITVSWEQQITE